MLAKLAWCGPKVQPCIRIDEGAVAFVDYRVILGY